MKQISSSEMISHLCQVVKLLNAWLWMQRMLERSAGCRSKPVFRLVSQLGGLLGVPVQPLTSALQWICAGSESMVHSLTEQFGLPSARSVTTHSWLVEARHFRRG